MKEKFMKWIDARHSHTMAKIRSVHKKSVWHEANEVPNGGTTILAQYDESTFALLVKNVYKDKDGVKHLGLFNVETQQFAQPVWKRWAYVEDLLKL